MADKWLKKTGCKIPALAHFHNQEYFGDSDSLFSLKSTCVSDGMWVSEFRKCLKYFLHLARMSSLLITWKWEAICCAITFRRAGRTIFYILLIPVLATLAVTGLIKLVRRGEGWKTAVGMTAQLIAEALSFRHISAFNPVQDLCIRTFDFCHMVQARRIALLAVTTSRQKTAQVEMSTANVSAIPVEPQPLSTTSNPDQASKVACVITRCGEIAMRCWYARPFPFSPPPTGRPTKYSLGLFFMIGISLTNASAWFPALSTVAWSGL